MLLGAGWFNIHFSTHSRYRGVPYQPEHAVEQAPVTDLGVLRMLAAQAAQASNVSAWAIVIGASQIANHICIHFITRGPFSMRLVKTSKSAGNTLRPVDTFTRTFMPVGACATTTIWTEIVNGPVAIADLSEQLFNFEPDAARLVSMRVIAGPAPAHFIKGAMNFENVTGYRRFRMPRRRRTEGKEGKCCGQKVPLFEAR